MSNTINTHLYTDAAGELLERSYQVDVVAGADAGKTMALGSGTAIIGTHPNTDMVLTDPKVSRYHLELQVLRDGIRIKDLDSTNGTTHRGTKLGSIIVGDRARLCLGKHTELEIVPVDATVELQDYASDRFGAVIGRSDRMRQLFAFLSRVAGTDATLLLLGETGSGKEAVAEAVHAHSNRAAGPFVVVDCGAIPHHLIGSELFGHARGAYTGATSDKAGLIETASGGTLFLDEIGELSLDLQPQLLRVLDKREVRRIGETAAIRVDIRVIAATHRDLRQMVSRGDFREDLYYRLAVVKTEIPPLRSRLEDIELLARHFAAQLGRGGFSLSERFLHRLAAHSWPGNVRELRNVIERALSLGTSTEIAALPADAPDPPRSSEEILELPFKEAKAQLVEGFEREYLTHLLDRHNGNISRAASEAGIDRNYIHRLIKKYDLEVKRR